jgi:hypothetical protein
MFPIAIIGAVIGIAVSGTKGAEWVSDKLDSATGTGSAGSKAGPTALTKKQAASFAATLAAQIPGRACLRAFRLQPPEPRSTSPKEPITRCSTGWRPARWPTTILESATGRTLVPSRSPAPTAAPDLSRGLSYQFRAADATVQHFPPPARSFSQKSLASLRLAKPLVRKRQNVRSLTSAC